MSSLSYTLLSNPIHPFFPNPNPTLPFHRSHGPLYLRQRRPRFSVTFSSPSGGRNVTSDLPAGDFVDRRKYPKLPPDFLRTFAASTILFLGFGLRAFSASASTHIPPIADCETVVEQHTIEEDGDAAKPSNVENMEDEEMRAAFESWKSKTYALTVPLRVVALCNSIPPLWIKNFIQSQGKRVKLRLEFRGSLEDIFSELSTAFSKAKVAPKSAVAADIVTLGDTWLSFAINKALIEPIQELEDQDWFNNLSNKWKVYLRRNSEGKLDSEGRIWAAPYRWGSIVIAYKKRKFKKHKLAPIEDWGDLWRPELAGKISMVDSPREVVGAVLKHMGASYNTKDIDTQVIGGRIAVQQNLDLLQKQVRVFDSVQYLKAFGVGDVWVAVGWSSDIIPTAKRMNDVAVVVPKSGASLWADFWAIPAASKLNTDQIGGRIRGPSPLVHQWIDFCMQAQRALPFKQEIVPGASPSALESAPVEGSQELGKNKPKLDTNLIAGVPPPEILEKCEFLEPLSDAALSDYRWVINGMQKPSHGLVQGVRNKVRLVAQRFSDKVPVAGSLK